MCIDSIVVVYIDSRIVVYNSSPQPFLHHGPVSCKTIFLWIGLQGVWDKYEEIK